MIKSVTVINHRGETVKMELRNPASSGFLITDITGLGPVKATINQTEILSTDGSMFNSSRLTSRNIVLTLRYLWAKTVEDARLASYRYFPIKKEVRLIIETDNRTCYADGYVETNEPVIFSNASSTQISIVCPSSYLYDYSNGGIQTTNFAAVDPKFEFSYSFEHGKDEGYDDTFIFGDSVERVVRNIVYLGDEEMGFTIRVVANGPASDFVVANVNTREFLALDDQQLALLDPEESQPIKRGDVITISTAKGSKSAILRRGGVEHNILHCITKNSSWLTLIPGSNEITYDANGSANLNLNIDHKVAYTGV